MSSSTPSSPSADSDQSYEDALRKLDTIVQRLEEENPPLGELVSAYEEGIRLFKICEERLQQAELRIEILQNQSNERD